MTLEDILPLFPPLPPEQHLPRPVVVLDTETTGFPAGMKGGHPDARVIEFGAVALGVDGVPFAILELLIKPHKFPAAGLWEGIIKAGLTQELLEAEGMTAADAHKRICDWWPRFATTDDESGRERPQAPIPWAAFNAPFDGAILRQSNLMLPVFDEQRRCIMLAAMDCLDASNALPRWRNGTPKWPTCDEAMRFLGIDYHHPHRALPDAVGEALVAVTLRRRGWAPWR